MIFIYIVRYVTGRMHIQANLAKGNLDYYWYNYCWSKKSDRGPDASPTTYPGWVQLLLSMRVKAMQNLCHYWMLPCEGGNVDPSYDVVSSTTHPTQVWKMSMADTSSSATQAPSSQCHCHKAASAAVQVLSLPLSRQAWIVFDDWDPNVSLTRDFQFDDLVLADPKQHAHHHLPHPAKSTSRETESQCFSKTAFHLGRPLLNSQPFNPRNASIFFPILWMSSQLFNMISSKLSVVPFS